MNDVVMAGLFGLGGTAFGFLLAQIPRIVDRRAQLKTLWTAVGVELAICQDRARELVRARIAAPLYRLPTAAYRIALPTLLSDGRLPEESIRTISLCFGLIEEINRGLDNAHEFRKAGSVEDLQAEYKRLVGKVEALLGNDEQGLLPGALAAARQRVALHDRWQ